MSCTSMESLSASFEVHRMHHRHRSQCRRVCIHSRKKPAPSPVRARKQRDSQLQQAQEETASGRMRSTARRLSGAASSGHRKSPRSVRKRPTVRRSALVVMTRGRGPKMRSIMAKCSKLSCVWNVASPVKSSRRIQPTLHRSQGYVHPSPNTTSGAR